MPIWLIYYSLFFFMSFLLFILSVKFMVLDHTYFVKFSLFKINKVWVEMSILLDGMSLLFMSFVLFISSMVIFYSEKYMMGKINFNRFILLVVLFVLSMMLLIIKPNLISILLGWDGLGLVSYCLVIYYQNVKSFNAGMLTVLSNRVGDIMLLLAIAWMMNYGSWNFIFYTESMNNDLEMKYVGFLIILAAFTKSAQIPFSSWLPAAMAAPTPVSALVHSSTLVTAGVYLLIRFNLLMQNFNLIILFIGLITMFMSGLGANFEFDLKKIIALSTLSQLGLMVSIISLGGFMLSFYHLLTHALFKALLFMCAGNMIHNLNNMQDIRFMGSLINKMPLTICFFNISNLSLCGLPFFSGFYSKDLVVEFLSFSSFNFFVYLIYYISIGLTVAYSFRLSFYLINSNFYFLSLNNLSENSFKMLKSMGCMMFMVIFSGSMLNWMIFDIPYLIILPLWMKLLTLTVIFIGILVGLLFSEMVMSSNLWGLKNLYTLKFLSLMWNMPFISTVGMNYMFLSKGKKYIKFMDQGWSEMLGSQQLYNSIKNFSLDFQYLFKNNFKIYLILIVSWMLMILIFYLL
uniref:NADH-ubiquinone oxidoreductase chain 5 n=1 Tax=Cryptolaemus montrouzieri TaxID=559131 RepID=A0A0X9Q0M9_9CUCU|nr:NADH dehydrogenase subunit 5 [Cryptolaemus montrouzieri]